MLSRVFDYLVALFLALLFVAILYPLIEVAAGRLGGINARGHTHPLSGTKNAANEWCCGDGDCFVQVKVTYNATHRAFVIHDPLTGVPVEAVPESEAQPSPDGAYWRCQRPDKSRRCFFAPRPNS